MSQELFEVDRNRLTCAGGTAALDMMLSLIMRDHGPGIAAQVTDQLIHHRIREAGEHQRMDLRARLDVAHPKVLAAVALMERSIEKPLSCAALAAAAGLLDAPARAAVPQVSRPFADEALRRGPARAGPRPPAPDQPAGDCPSRPPAGSRRRRISRRATRAFRLHAERRAQAARRGHRERRLTAAPAGLRRRTGG